MKRFDHYEISKVAEYMGDEPDGKTFCEQVDDDFETEPTAYRTDEPIRTFWTLYGHLPEGGVMAIADREDKASCEELLDRITGGMPTDVEIRQRDLKITVVILITEDSDNNLRASIHADLADAAQRLEEFTEESGVTIKRHVFVLDYWDASYWLDHAIDPDHQRTGGL